MTDAAASLRDHALATVTDSRSLRERRADLLAARRGALAQQKTLRAQHSGLSDHCKNHCEAIAANIVRWRTLIARLPPEFVSNPTLPVLPPDPAGC